MNKILKGRFTVLLCTFFFWSSAPVFAQNYEKEFETLFAWEVKQIDEFIERFNNTDKTLIREYSQKVDPGKEINRERLIKSLFNAENKNWNFNDISNFIQKVNNAENPVLLSFYDQDWYAKIKCDVTYKGRPETATLTLKIDRQPTGESKWIITGVQAPFLQNATASIIDVPASQDNSVTLNPVSHATDFMNIDLVSKDPRNIGNYFGSNYNQNKDLAKFINECMNQRLEIKKANSITYHFLQVEDWVFEIQQYNRQTKNAGWLISKLIKATPEEKATYRAQILKQ